MKRILICALLTLVPTFALAQEMTRILTVTGNGVVARAPDMAVIRVGVTHDSPRAAEALDQTSQAMTRMQRQLTEAGIAARDIQTTQLSLDPIYDPNSDTRRITGFRATNSVTIRVRDIAMTGTILGALVGDGANRIDGISFTLSDSKAALEAARTSAVQDAMDKAAQLAQAAGVSLGALRDIREVGGGLPDPRPMMRVAAAAPVPLAEGEISVSAAVTMVYEIE